MATKLRDYLQEQDYDVMLFREPGSTEVAEEIRQVIQKPREDVQVRRLTELLLYEAARAQFVDEVLRPALEKGRIVILDRFYDSTTAYQGFGRGLDLQLIQSLNELATRGIRPDVTFLLDVSPEVALERCSKDEFGEADRMEQEHLDFHRTIQEGYHHIAEQEPERVKVIDSESQEVEEAFEEVKEVAERIINTRLHKEFKSEGQSRLGKYKEEE